MDVLVKILAVTTTAVTIRKVWHTGTKSKLEVEKLRLEIKKSRRGG